MTENITPPQVETVPPVIAAPESTPSPTPVSPSTEAPVEAPKSGPVVEAPKEAAKEATTVLGAEPAKEVAKEAEVKGEEIKKTDGVGPEVKKDEGTQSDNPAPSPEYEAFTLPEGLTFEDDKIKEFTKDLGEFEGLAKADHAEVQKFGQKLVDRHIAEVQETVKRLNEHYTKAWEKQKNDWKESFVKDPEIGGNQQDTTVKAALEFIRTHGGTDSHQKEFRDLMETTGIGNHPAMIRMLANAMKANREGGPLPAAKPVPEATSKVSKRYGNI